MRDELAPCVAAARWVQLEQQLRAADRPAAPANKVLLVATDGVENESGVGIWYVHFRVPAAVVQVQLADGGIKLQAWKESGAGKGRKQDGQDGRRGVGVQVLSRSPHARGTGNRARHLHRQGKLVPGTCSLVCCCLLSMVCVYACTWLLHNHLQVNRLIRLQPHHKLQGAMQRDAGK